MFSRSSQQVLARFSSDEMRHVRNRRGTAEETSQAFLDAVLSIERAQRKLADPDIDEDERDDLEKKLRRRLSNFCEWVGYDAAPEVEDCKENKYRSFDGVCNNIDNPNWGKAGYPYLRLLPSAYKDGIARPRWYKSTAREVSKAFVGNEEGTFSTHGASELVMHFGQFLDHDINLTPALRVNCTCTDDDENNSCFSIPCDDEDDEVCGTAGCIPFRRSRPTIPGDCAPGSRTHENTITSFVDASNVYGSFPEDAEALLDKEEGQGKMQVEVQVIDEVHIHLLPPDKENQACLEIGDKNHCGRGGDVRAAEQPGLTSLHTLFVREHNRIAGLLYSDHSDWDDDRLYQEARQILVAVMQKITYDEFLPLVLGKEIMDKYKLGSWNGYDGYNKTVNPTITNEFAAAFMRFGHSMIPDTLTRVTSLYDHDEFPSIEMRSSFFNAAHMYETEYGSVSSLLLGMICSKLLPVDRHFSKSVSTHLFENPLTGKGGIDLIALNIQRSRDHGLPAYPAYRRHCNLTVPDSWDDLDDIMDSDTQEALKRVYKDVDKIDIFVGMHAEKPAPGALVGITTACVLGEQFKNLKYGDRFWYENTERDGWTQDQVEAIQKMTLARLICENIRLDSIQPAVFKLPDEKQADDGRYFYELILEAGYPEKTDFNNHRVSCSDKDEIPDISLDAWADI
ncbi:peroxidasin homolog pxn-2-like isoform X2 [Apostichopus japonicus]